MDAGKGLNLLRKRVDFICQNPDHPERKPKEFKAYANLKWIGCCIKCRKRLYYLSQR